MPDDKIVSAHRDEIGKADIFKFGCLQGDTEICSKTDKGTLCTEIENGKIIHEWD